MSHAKLPARRRQAAKRTGLERRLNRPAKRVDGERLQPWVVKRHPLTVKPMQARSAATGERNLTEADIGRRQHNSPNEGPPRFFRAKPGARRETSACSDHPCRRRKTVVVAFCTTGRERCGTVKLNGDLNGLITGGFLFFFSLIIFRITVG